MSPRLPAFFLPNLHGGGAEKMALALVRGFASCGVRCRLVLANALSDYGPQDDLEIVDLGCRRLALAGLALAGWLQRERPPWLLAGMTQSNCLALGTRMLCRTTTRIIVRQENVISQVAKMPHSAFTGLCLRLVPHLYPRADAIIAISNGVAHDLAAFARLPPSRIRTIYNPACPTERELLGPLANHRWLGPGKDRPVVVAAGRLTGVKDFHSAIRAFALLRSKRPVRLIILGQGPLKSDLAALAGSLGCAADVDLAGFHPEPCAVMRGCDLFLLSSLSEGFGNVLVEALACGLRIVSTDCPGGPGEILDHGTYGRLVPVGDPAAMAAAMLAALDEPASPLARRRAVAFSQRTIAAQHLQAIADAG